MVALLITASLTGALTLPPQNDPAAAVVERTGHYCRRGVCTASLRPGRREEGLTFRWSKSATPPILGGATKVIGNIRAHFNSTLPHRTVLRIRTELKRERTKEERTSTFSGRLLQFLDLPVPDTVSAGKQHCRGKGVCVDPVKRRVEEHPRAVRWGKAGKRASFFAGSVERRKDVVNERFGLKYTKRRRNTRPIALRGEAPPQMRNQRFY